MNTRDGRAARIVREDAPAAPPPDSTPVARLEAVGVGPGVSPTLRRLSFALPPGSAHVLTGPSGSGKSLLLALLGLEVRPTLGRLQLFGRDAATLGRAELPLFRRRIGRVFAADRLLEHLTVFDNAALVPHLAGRDRADYERDVSEVLAWMGLARRADTLPSDLQPAERRRLALARAVANRPDLLLVDEPGAGLERPDAAGILERLAELNRAGTTLVMAMASEVQALAIGATVLRLSEGSVSVVESFQRAASA